MTSEKQAKNVVKKVQDEMKVAVQPAKSRQDKRRQEKERAKLRKQLEKNGQSKEAIDYAFFVQDNAEKANEIFMQLQNGLNELGYYLQGKIETNRNDGSTRGAVTVGVLPQAQFLEGQERARQVAKKDTEPKK